MKKRIKKCASLLLITILTACTAANNTWIPLNLPKINTNERAKTETTIYALTFGQERYMNTLAVILGSFSMMANSFNMQSGFRYNRDNGISNISRTLDEIADSIRATDYRKNSSELEKKLGDFNLLSFFNEQFYAVKDSIQYFDLKVSFDSTEHAQIVNRLCTYQNENLDPAFTKKLNNDGNKYISGFKFQYGIGGRAGGEQFSLTKKYRPFVRVVGLIKDVNTNEFVWGNKIIVFSETVYQGKDEAKNADKDELIQEFKIITDQLIDIIISDLNGQRYLSEEYLFDYNPQVDDLL